MITKVDATVDMMDYLEDKYGNGKKAYISGDEIPVSGALIDMNDIRAVVDVALDGWFTEGKVSAEFAKSLCKYVGSKHVTLCNSGSSASLLAVSALAENCAEGRKVVTCATGFPTTVAPIIQNKLIPLFVDVNPKTLNADREQLHEALHDRDVCGVIMAHTLGFPFDAFSVAETTKELGKWFIEDIADALGAEINDKRVGTFGDASILSFFPAHHITTGEGGAVFTNNGRLKKVIDSYGSWGRDCWCLPGSDNTCGKRFGWDCKDLPAGWDHKYTFTRLGYNLKITELQSALGLSQMRKIDKFVKARISNFEYLLINLAEFQEYLEFVEYAFYANPSPFGFPITVKPSAPFDRNSLVKYLESNKIRTRPVFGGNLTRHSAFKKSEIATPYPLSGSDYVMNNTFWIGCAPMLTTGHLDYVIETIQKYFERKGLWTKQ
jgi:CDP-6-deoxy-D-xylo-4-hexulose-3-dehydrase